MTATTTTATTTTAAQDAGSPELLISDVVTLTGLSQDTLRWYEREGLLPAVARGTDRRRRYSARDVSLLQVLVRLRRTGMPTRQVRRFSELVSGGAATHGARMALLLEHRRAALARLQQVQDDLAALDHKIEHYRSLIGAGLDCDGSPVATARPCDLPPEGSRARP